uniref:Ring finger protein 135 n=1 Tax=Cebus imitator TaxID=2715852 RepID=A0A2K5S032_CEBIM
MAGLGPGPAVPVWLAEDDLGCIICQGLLDCPATLPCGHSFCRRCLESLWDARGAGDRWACPTCREVAAQQPQLRKNTLLQDLADKYRCAAREVEADPDSALRPGPGPSPAPRPRRSRSLPRGNSWKPCLPPHAHCLTRATLHSGELLSLLSGPLIQPLT